MGKQAQWQAARRTAREAKNARQRQRAAKDQRLEDLAVVVLVSVGHAAEYERQAGAALRTMIESEGLTIREAVDWCGVEISLRDAMRLRRLSDRHEVPGQETDASPGTDEPAAPSHASTRNLAWSPP